MKAKTPKRLLLADHEPDYLRSMRGLLEFEGYEVVVASTPESAVSELSHSRLDLAVIDLRFDHDDSSNIAGLNIAKHAREMNIPCIISTGYETVEYTRMALRARGGEPLADDLVPKNQGPQALLDAISLMLSRTGAPPSAPGGSGLVIDLDKGLVWKKGKLVNLSRSQFELVAYMFQHVEAVCEPEAMIKAVYGSDVSHKDAMTDRRLERLITRVREKIEDHPSSPRYLKIVPGRGYVLTMSSDG